MNNKNASGLRIAHVGWRGSDRDTQRLASVSEALGITSAEHDYIDLFDGRDFLLETGIYDIVLLHEIPRYRVSPAHDRNGLFAVSPQHAPARWRERLMGTRARLIVAFGGARHVTWAYLNSLEYSRQSVSRWGCVYARQDADRNALCSVTFPAPLDEFEEPPDELPQELRTLFDIVNEDKSVWYGSDNVTAAELRDHVVSRARAVYPDAIIKEDLRLPRGVVDVAIITPSFTIGAILHGSDMVFERPRRGTGMVGFDHAVAIDAGGCGAASYDRPHYVHVLRPCLADGQMRFRCLRAGWRSDPADPLALLLKRDVRKGVVRDAHAFIYKHFSKERRVPRRLTGGEIAAALMEHLGKNTASPAVLIRELSIGAYNSNVADIAVATPASLDLYEIKGESDGASRLAGQVEAYDAVANTCTLVLAANKASLSRRVPPHWGIIYAALERGRIRFTQVRRPEPNPLRKPVYVAQFLLTANLHSICRIRALRARWRHCGVDDLRAAAAGMLPISDLTTLATRALAARYDAQLRKTAVVHKGDLGTWPSVRAVLAGGEAPLLISGG